MPEANNEESPLESLLSEGQAFSAAAGEIVSPVETEIEQTSPSEAIAEATAHVDIGLASDTFSWALIAPDEVLAPVAYSTLNPDEMELVTELQERLDAEEVKTKEDAERKAKVREKVYGVTSVARDSWKNDPFWKKNEQLHARAKELQKEGVDIFESRKIAEAEFLDAENGLEEVASTPKNYPLPIHLDIEHIDMVLDATEARFEKLLSEHQQERADYIARKKSEAAAILAKQEDDTLSGRCVYSTRRVDTREESNELATETFYELKILEEAIARLREATPNFNLRVGKFFKIRDTRRCLVDRMKVTEIDSRGHYVCVSFRTQRSFQLMKDCRSYFAFGPEILEDLGYEYSLELPLVREEVAAEA